MDNSWSSFYVTFVFDARIHSKFKECVIFVRNSTKKILVLLLIVL